MIAVKLAPDGATPEELTARDNVQLTLPTDPATNARNVTAQQMEGSGEPGRGLTVARFSGNVVFRERGADVERVARSGALDVRLATGASAIEEAQFTKAVRFEQGDMKATSTGARYVIAGDQLQLADAERGGPPPHIENDRISVDAAHLEVTLTGPKVKATGAVKSVLRAAASKHAGASANPPDVKVPSLLKQDQPINVTAESLDYDGTASKAVYRDNAQLWQGDTTLKGSSIIIDDRTGDLRATKVATRMVLIDEHKDKPSERVSSAAVSDDLEYEDFHRRAMYAGNARLTGPEGDLTATKIEVYLKESGDQIDHLEAYENVVLQEPNQRKTTGRRLTYYDAEGRYVVTGSPVKVVDQCGRETIGRSLTFNRTTDSIVVDGSEQRTQTKGKSDCP
jgi:lipopolysaccharide export system protein LptA